MSSPSATWLEAAHAAEMAADVLTSESRKQKHAPDRRAYELAAQEVRALAHWFYRRALRGDGDASMDDEATPPVEVLDDVTPVDGE